MSDEWRDNHCAQCGTIVGRIRVGSRGTMLCRYCQEYDVPRAGEYRAEGGLTDGGLFDWIRDGFKRERGQ